MGAIWVGNGVQRCQQVHMDGCYMGGYWGTEMPAGAHGWVPVGNGVQRCQQVHTDGYRWVLGYRDASRCTGMGARVGVQVGIG
jgi:hypothetical protein